MSLSAAIISFNEEKNIARTLESVKFADQIVVVDSFSKDRTVEIARAYGAEVYSEAFKGHGGQKNSALDKCTGDWIFLIDADEVVTPELRAEIERVVAGSVTGSNGPTAYWVPRLNQIFGHWMRHGGFYPDRKLRLFKKGAARLLVTGGPHDTPEHTGDKGVLKGDLLHFAYPTLELYLEHMDRYSNEMAGVVLKKGKASAGLPAFVTNVFLNPVATFIYNYIFRLGFLDGREGLLLHMYHSGYVSWKYAKAWERARKPSDNTN